MGATNIREMRYRDPSGFSTTFTNAASATWAPGTAIKLRVTAYDDSGLVFDASPDLQLRSSLYARAAPVPTLRRGSFSFSTYLGAAFGNVTPNPEATLLSKFMGGLSSPSAKTDTCETGSTSTGIVCTGHGMSVGMAVLIGTRGDSAGNGEVRRIATVTNADHYVLEMALTGSPSSGHVIVNSHTVFLNASATVTPLDFLAIGQDTEDQRQMIGCMGGFAVESAEPGEVPQLKFDMTHVGDHQWVPSNQRDQLEPTLASQGTYPPVDRGYGGLFLQDQNSTTRTVYKSSGLSIPSFVTFADQPDRNGINGVGGYERLPPADGIMASFNLLLPQDTGLYDDFANNATSSGATQKQLLLQWGHTAQRCCAISLPKCHIASAPVTADVNGLRAVAVSVVADEGTAGNALTDSAIAIHYF